MLSPPSATKPSANRRISLRIRPVRSTFLTCLLLGLSSPIGPTVLMAAPQQGDRDQDLGTEFEHEVIVTSSRDHPISDAGVRLHLEPGSAADGTITEETVQYRPRGEGRYVATLPLAARDRAQYNYRFVVEAPEDHRSRTIKPGALIETVELFHDAYVARCNEFDDESGPLAVDPWGDCSVDAERLVETFGTETATTRGFGRIELFLIHPDKELTDVTSLVTRPEHYEEVIETTVKGPALAQAKAANTAVAELIEEQRAEAEEASFEEVAATGASVVSGFSESLEMLSQGLGGTADVLELIRAYERGQRDGELDALLQLAGYFPEAERALEHLEEEAKGTALWDDPAFREALENVEGELREQRDVAPRELAEARARGAMADAAAEILLGATVKTSLGMGLKGLGAAGGIKGIAAVMAYDLLAAGRAQREAHIAMAMAGLMDRQALGDYPDRVDREDVVLMDEAEQRGALMRLSLGVFFNQTRAAYLAGEDASWLEDAVDFAIEGIGIEREDDAYDAAMVEASQEKMERAKEDIALLGDVDLAERDQADIAVGSEADVSWDDIEELDGNRGRDYRIDIESLQEELGEEAVVIDDDSVFIKDYPYRKEGVDVYAVDITSDGQEELTVSGRPGRHIVFRLRHDGYDIVHTHGHNLGSNRVLHIDDVTKNGRKEVVYDYQDGNSIFATRVLYYKDGEIIVQRLSYLEDAFDFTGDGRYEFIVSEGEHCDVDDEPESSSSATLRALRWAALPAVLGWSAEKQAYVEIDGDFSLYYENVLIPRYEEWIENRRDRGGRDAEFFIRLYESCIEYLENEIQN